MTQAMFCSEVEVGGFVGSIDVVPEAFRAVSETSSSSSSYGFHTTSSGIQILAFNCSIDYRNRFLSGGFDLVSSETFKVVDFIGTKVNPSFFISEVAVELFESLPLELKQLKDELINKPLIVTGLSLGGYIAVLFALWLQHAVDVKEASGSKDTKRPICITFGCPLVGDEALQRSVSERPQWKSGFLNVVAKTDPVASFISSKIQAERPYKPFGTFLFCTESGGHTAFEDQESVLAVLHAMASSRHGNMEVPDYENHLTAIRRKALYRGVSEFGQFNLNPLRAGITWQFKEVGMLDEIPNNLIERMEDKQTRAIKSKKHTYEPTKKLNDMKISLTFMEWYMKTWKPKRGYYDTYKNPETIKEKDSNNGIELHRLRLNQYWQKFVTEKDLLPQKEGAKLRKRWLYSGNNYRRIVEPLDIAEHYKSEGKYYKNGNKHYLADRPNHYKLLEDWSNEDKKGSDNPIGGKKKAASLTEDSCFWAHVEEALISLRELKNEGSGSHADVRNQELENFETKVMGEIKSYSLSPDVFLEGSSFMKWWNEYKQHKGGSYVSEFARYMNERSYKLYK
ncbi:senescence-associated carboxylesterase 101-like [Cynara cardunculus var. scolymus]|uniref:senescence-associated carboxylesterase 101-like n=1 Tax=Cynara cardunculus var. scolymus TaxID=59895 RepID=UPI000D622E99|nr:senescence-associated carboxylesterase 101-like [Cynara cardunculus var. scolymus]